MAELTEPFDANGDERGVNKRVGYPHDACEDWLALAARLPGKSLHLATVLQSLAKVAEHKQVVLSNLVCQEFGIDRNAKYRALRSARGCRTRSPSSESWVARRS